MARKEFISQYFKAHPAHSVAEARQRMAEANRAYRQQRGVATNPSRRNWIKWAAIVGGGYLVYQMVLKQQPAALPAKSP